MRKLTGTVVFAAITHQPFLTLVTLASNDRDQRFRSSRWPMMETRRCLTIRSGYCNALRRRKWSQHLCIAARPPPKKLAAYCREKWPISGIEEGPDDENTIIAIYMEHNADEGARTSVRRRATTDDHSG
jgi:hypothetical protein